LDSFLSSISLIPFKKMLQNTGPKRLGKLVRYRTHKHTHKHITLRCKTFNGQHCVHRLPHPSCTVVLSSVSKHTGLDSPPHHIEGSAQIELHPHQHCFHLLVLCHFKWEQYSPLSLSKLENGILKRPDN